MMDWIRGLIGRGEAAEIREGLRRIARDVFDLEVNTIAKAGMTARKMPAPPHALLDIAGKYYWYLLDLSHAHGRSDVAAAVSLLAPERRRNSAQTFETVRKVCAELLRDEADRTAIPAADRVIVERVMRNCLELTTLIDRAVAENPPELFEATRAELAAAETEVRKVRIPVDDITVLRKIWEVGVESVVMQSVIALDGDVVTRIHHEHAGAESKPLHDLHLAATRTAIDTWSTVVKLLATLIHRLIGLIAAGR